MLSATAFKFEDTAYFLNSSARRLERYDLASDTWTAPIALASDGSVTAAPKAALVNEDGIYASFGSVVYRYDATGANRQFLFSLASDVQEIHSDGNLLIVNASGYISGNYRTRFISYDKATGTILQSFTGSIYDDRSHALRGTSISTPTNTIFGGHLQDTYQPLAVGYTDEGAFHIVPPPSIYNAATYTRNTWVSPDGHTFFDNGADAYSAPSLAYVNPLDTAPTDMDFTSGGDSIVVSGYTVTRYSSALLPTNRLTLVNTYREVFVDDQDAVLFATDNSSSTGFRALVVPLSSIPPLTPKAAINPVDLPFDPDQTIKMPNGNLMMLERERSNVYLWDPTVQRFTQTIRLLGAARSIAYFPTSNTLFVSYDSGLITRLDLSSTSNVEIPIRTVRSSAQLLKVGNYLAIADGYNLTIQSLDGQIVAQRGTIGSSNLEKVWSDVNQKFYISSFKTITSVEFNENGSLSGVPINTFGVQKFASMTRNPSSISPPLYLSPTENMLLTGTGERFSVASLAVLSPTLDNQVVDAAWLSSGLFTIAQDTNVLQKWTTTYTLGASLTPRGTGKHLVPLDGNKFLSISLDTFGVPFFVVYDSSLSEVAPPNGSAPTLTNTSSVAFATIKEDDLANNLSTGTSITSLTQSRVTDPDSGSLRGIAVIGTTGNGTWEYSFNGGTSWQPVGNVSDTSARLLPSSTNVKLRFRPNLNFEGPANIYYRAWDRTQGYSGDLFDTTNRLGGANSLSMASGTGTVTVQGVQDKPFLTQHLPVLPTILEDDPNPVGTHVSDLIDGYVFDPDVGALRGIGVSRLTGVGTWQYSLDDQATWQAIGPMPAFTLRLLADTAYVRFLPAANAFGNATIEFRAWDRTLGQSGEFYNRLSQDTSCFSDQSDQATITVTPVNDPPSVYPYAQFALDDMSEDTVNQGRTTQEIFNYGISDVDPSSARGVAVTQVDNTIGAWEYSLDSGSNWFAFSGVSSTSAQLFYIDATTRFRFVPNPNQNGQALLTFKGWDQTAGSVDAPFDTTTTTAFSTPASVRVNVLPVNDGAPSIDPGSTPDLNTINEDETANLGTLVAALAAGMSDVDYNSLKGIAVTSASDANGVWQYTLDGSNWYAFNSPSLASARLLPADGLARVRFVPRANFNGDVYLFIRAWDQSQGTVGQTADLTTSESTGGTTAFSLLAANPKLTVVPVNDAPQLNVNVQVALSSITEDTVNPAGALVSSLLSGASDIDNTTSGMAVYLINATAGSWQYALNGTSWLNFGNTTLSAARLLPADATTRIRFVPNANFNGEVGLWFYAWDRTQGVAGGTWDISAGSSLGGTTAFSSVADRVSQPITLVNDAPTLTAPSTLGAAFNTPVTFSGSSAIKLTDIDAGGFELQVTIQTSPGTFSLGSQAGVYYTEGFNGQPYFTFRGTLAALNNALVGSTFTPTPNYSGAASVQVTFSDLGAIGSGGPLVASKTINILVSPLTVTIDNGQSGYNETAGVWTASGLTGNAGSSTWYSVSSSASVRWTATLPPGFYSVSIYNVVNANSTTNARVSLVHNGITEPDQTLNQTIGTSGYVTLGSFYFSGSASEYVQLSKTGSGNLRADAVRFTRLPGTQPSIVAPGAQTTLLNTSITFSSALSRPITVTDADAMSTTIEQVSVSVSSGTLTLGATDGITIVSGGNGQGSIVIQGTLASLNAALDGLEYSPALDSHDTATLQIMLDDLGNDPFSGALTFSRSIEISVVAPFETMIDNGLAGYSEVGSWYNSGLTGVNGSSTRFSAISNAAAVWTPTLSAGYYTVLLYKVVHPASSTNAKVTIAHNGAAEQQTLDLTSGSSGFATLGTFYFSGSGAEFIRLSQNAPLGNLRADAVKFVRVG